jgi:hypothetical protein
MEAYTGLKGRYYHLVWSIMLFTFVPVVLFLVYEAGYWGSWLLYNNLSHLPFKGFFSLLFQDTSCDFTQFSYYEPGRQGILIGNPLYTDYEEVYHQYYYQNNTSPIRANGKMPLHLKQMIYLDHYNYIRYAGLGETNIGDNEVGSMRHVLTSPRTAPLIRSLIILTFAPALILVFIRAINGRCIVNGRPLIRFYSSGFRIRFFNYASRMRFMYDDRIQALLAISLIYVLVSHSFIFH